MSVSAKIFTSLCLVVSTFILGSIFVKGSNFYLFFLLWQLVTLFFFRPFIRESVRGKQGFYLIGFLSLNWAIAKLLAPNTNSIYLINSVSLGPLVEEIFFRGFILSNLNGSTMKKIFLNSLLFAVYHIKNLFVLSPTSLIYQILYAGFIVGPVCTYLTIRTGNLKYSIGVHSLNNLFAKVLTPRLFPGLFKLKI